MSEDGTAARTPLIERLRRQKEHHKERGKLVRIAVAAAGFALVLVGVALIPLPGPGWLIVAIGFAILALEFDRAERVVEWILERIERVGERAAHASPLKKALGLLALGLAGAAAVAAVLLWEIPHFPG